MPRLSVSCKSFLPDNLAPFFDVCLDELGKFIGLIADRSQAKLLHALCDIGPLESGNRRGVYRRNELFWSFRRYHQSMPVARLVAGITGFGYRRVIGKQRYARG